MLKCEEKGLLELINYGIETVLVIHSAFHAIVIRSPGIHKMLAFNMVIVCLSQESQAGRFGKNPNISQLLPVVPFYGVS